MVDKKEWHRFARLCRQPDGHPLRCCADKHCTTVATVLLPFLLPRYGAHKEEEEEGTEGRERKAKEKGQGAGKGSRSNAGNETEFWEEESAEGEDCFLTVFLMSVL